MCAPKRAQDRGSHEEGFGGNRRGASTGARTSGAQRLSGGEELGKMLGWEAP